MVIGRIIGNIVCTVKHKDYQAKKLLIVQPLNPQGEPSGDSFIAVDAAQAGPEDLVLVVREGNSARQVVKIPDAPILSIIVGVIDEVEMEGRISLVGP
ncbi:MAG: EutN/CcmL family microcompartment protein [Chloroflexi bacterium]|nr:EutN/CcmL family microcompartment protein [Chloroflexota bacterium]MBI5956444.1 EutN/CcmL family microcompartment protein [Chloroflexota bacterium]